MAQSWTSSAASPVERHIRRRPGRLRGIATALALITSLLVSAAPATAGAQQTQPTIDDTARLLGYLWADGSYENGVWDATGPSGGSDIIQRLVILHGGTWVDRPQLKFTLPAPYNWADWKDSLPNDDARTRDAVQRPNFLAALLEGEGSVTGLVYDQSSCCTPGFTSGRLVELHGLLTDRGFSTATLSEFSNGDDSGEITIAASEFAELRAGHEFVCPAADFAIRVPGDENFDAYGPIRWYQANSEYGDVVRQDCVNGQPIAAVGAPVGTCVVTSDGNGSLRVTWTFQRGSVSIRRNNTFITFASAQDKVFVDTPSAGNHSYQIRVKSDDLRTDVECGVANTNDPFQPAPIGGTTCMGRIVTTLGTSGNDVLTGTPGADVIHGLGGDDEIFGLQGDDIICGGSGTDTVYAGKGNDTVWGGQGFDILFGAQGNDALHAAGSGITDILGSRMFGGAGNDTIIGSTRWDRMQGGDGHDVLRGYEGRDWMRGGAGNDQVIGDGGIDDLHGGNGTDFIQIQDLDTVRGGAGLDGCRYDATQGQLVLSCERTLTPTTSASFIAALR